MTDSAGLALYRDLLHYYQVDLTEVIDGMGPCPAFVVSLCEGLPDTSMTTAVLSGGMHLYGWGMDRIIAADQCDYTNILARIHGSSKNKPLELPYVRRPGYEGKKKKTRRGLVAALYAKMGGTGAH